VSEKGRGFTLVEVVTVMLIVSVLTRIALPQMQEVRVRARAAAVRADFQVVRHAAENFYADNVRWPNDTDAGVTPTDLIDDLPQGYVFDRGDYLLNWENWILPSGLPNDPSVRAVIGISLTTDDRALGAAVLDMINEAASYQLGSTYTFIFETF
jgi:prepilin-type N-terminal cleavage/methylation domain-containing protein